MPELSLSHIYISQHAALPACAVKGFYQSKPDKLLRSDESAALTVVTFLFLRRLVPGLTSSVSSVREVAAVVFRFLLSENTGFVSAAPLARLAYSGKEPTQMWCKVGM
jgi:hypothetical protein